MRIKETRKIDAYKVRQMCIKDNYYTRGTNEDYTNLLMNLCEMDADTYTIYIIATDIIEHSDYEKKMNEYGCTLEELTTYIMENLINECCYTSVTL